jgi:hypothetical protein
MTLLYKLHYKTYEFNHFFKFFHHKIKKHSCSFKHIDGEIHFRYEIHGEIQLSFQHFQMLVVKYKNNSFNLSSLLSTRWHSSQSTRVLCSICLVWNFLAPFLWFHPVETCLSLSRSPEIIFVAKFKPTYLPSGLLYFAWGFAKQCCPLSVMIWNLI